MSWKSVITAIMVSIAFAIAARGQQHAPAASPRRQLQQYVTQLQANPSDNALRMKSLSAAPTPGIHCALAFDRCGFTVASMARIHLAVKVRNVAWTK